MRESASVRREIALAWATAVGAVGVVEEDLLERGLAAREADDRMGSERRKQRLRAAVHLETKGVGAGALDPDAG
jgi:hypothetical protein